MRMIRLLLLFLLVGIVGWLVVRTVSVETTDEKVQITIDKQKLQQAGHDLEQRGREAADKVGEALQHAGKKLDDERDERVKRD